jgi:hypothetical protein
VKNEIYNLFNKYERKFGATRSQRAAQPASHTGKKKQTWRKSLKALDHLVLSSVVGPSLAPAHTSSQSASAVAYGLSASLDNDNVTTYEDDFDLLLWWCNHKLTYPILSIMVRDIYVYFLFLLSLSNHVLA